MSLSRRDFLRYGIVGGTLMSAPLSFPRPAWALSPQIPRFQQPFRVPPELSPVRSDATTDYYEIRLQKAMTGILPGLTTATWGYNGLFPGPTIRQQGGKRSTGGRQSVVRFINELGQDEQGDPISSVTHLHGMASLPQYDGFAEDFIPPNYFKDYIYPNDRAATIWYHDHMIDHTSRNVYRGLAGMYIVEDQVERDLGLPTGPYDVPLILQDGFFAADGRMVFDDRDRKSVYGDVALVNGVPWPRMAVGNRKYRFRILNASASRGYNLALSRDDRRLTLGDTLIVIGSDGGLLSEPVEVKTPYQVLEIGMAERYEVIIDFARYPVGSSVFLKNLGFTGSIDSDDRIHTLMRFDVVREEPDDSQLPNTLRPVERLSPTDAVRTRTLRFERNSTGWVINNQKWNAKAVMLNPRAGDVEIWELVNPGSGWFHPVHIHLIDMQMLDRNGRPPRPYERGWKDVFHVGEFETVRIIGKFGSRDGQYINGKFMLHCHNLVHEDHAMMTIFEVGRGGNDPLSAPARPVSEMRSL
ncbi:multicopper oxidase domain-containing protein [Nodosilinea sp. LEGE 07088]|uniref:multicopper oxidase family protein n=1 Tax=Nodosilinea sp. LEGE 07088 TaxID=2777968 RepID=UPI00187E9D62|nr:multicopper oxidase domain-containing protein [Nodosilinea sp. LEGE 07088]MBE9139964.1 multicopper oxidase domain-containing protein [Nodosilinea sp. LEGE 07088]